MTASQPLQKLRRVSSLARHQNLRRQKQRPTKRRRLPLIVALLLQHPYQSRARQSAPESFRPSDISFRLVRTTKSPLLQPLAELVSLPITAVAALAWVESSSLKKTDTQSPLSMFVAM